MRVMAEREEYKGNPVRKRGRRKEGKEGEEEKGVKIGKGRCEKERKTERKR